MIGFMRAHGMDPGPLQRPMLAGGLTGLAATAPAMAVFTAFGSLRVVAAQVFGLSQPITVAIHVAAFTAAGVLYGVALRRAANDRRGGWLFGLAFGFILWMAAPVVVLPLIGSRTMAAGVAATGFLACFLTWGLVAGALFPFVHRPLQAKMDGQGGAPHFGPDAAAIGRGLLRRSSRA